jgi:hypothetical protein
MRYRREDMPADPSLATTDDIYLFTLIFSIVIGVLLTWVGIKGRQVWLALWSAGLVVAAIGTLVWRTVAGTA